MKVEKKNGKVSRITTHSKEYKIVNNSEYADRYSDEGVFFYPKYRKGFTKNKKRRLRMFQVRMYKTWKHNRKTKWK
jgi:hypothetical protein